MKWFLVAFMLVLAGCGDPISSVSSEKAVVQVKDCHRDWNSSSVYEVDEGDLQDWIRRNELGWTFKGVRYTTIDKNSSFSAYSNYVWVIVKEC